MLSPKLIIRKRMQFIQGKMRPCCHVQAIVDPETRAKLEEHFLAEPLFKRSFYSTNWPDGAVPIPAALGPAMSQLLKNDACPEITVKTMLVGQLHQAANAWEMLSFELIAKLAFDNFRALAETAAELDRDVVYSGYGVSNHDAFEAETLAELSALTNAERAA
jgi:hypothetical protein